MRAVHSTGPNPTARWHALMAPPPLPNAPTHCVHTHCVHMCVFAGLEEAGGDDDEVADDDSEEDGEEAEGLWVWL